MKKDIDNIKSEIAKKILEYIYNQKNSMVALLKCMVQAESPSTDPGAQDAVFTLIEKALSEINFKVKRILGDKTGGCLLGIPSNREKGSQAQLLLGHCDTVWPVGMIKQMPITINDGRLTGPGVYDMKGGLMQIICALKILHHLKLTPAVTPVVLITSDEEIGGPESLSIIKRLAKHVNRALVLEPSLEPSGKLKTARKGVSNFEVIIHGKAAHAGIAPHEGSSVIPELSFVIQKLYALNNWEKGTTINVGTVDGGIRANVIAATCKATVDVRVLTRQDEKNIEGSILDIKPTTSGTRLQIKKTRSRSPMERTPRNQALWRQAKDLGCAIGLELEEGISGGASDGNITSLFTATLDGLGPVGDGAHAHHEYINIEKTMERAALLTLLLMEPPI